MSCKNDQDWEGSYVYKQQCVQWTDLVALREKFNQVWDILKKEDRQDNVKYGYRTETDESAKEQTRHDLATINGFCSVRFNAAGNYDEIYFKITSGSILQRLEALGSEYSYDNQVGGQSADFGPWIVYLKDPCYGCTGFRFQNRDIPYRRTISCNSTDSGSFPDIDIDPTEWKAQCIWTLSGGCDTSSGATVISDWQQYCHFNFDWRSSYAEKFGDVASKLFAKGPICVPVGEPCTVSRNYCCNEYALAHYTEEFMDHSLCPENETAVATGMPFAQWPYRMRRLKWVSLGVNLTNPQDEEQPFDDETFFCCDNTITGGVFEGHVTQKISAIHLTNIWDRVNTMVGGKTLRTCEKEKCQFDSENPKEKDKWHFKATVPMYIEGGGTPDILDRKIPDQSPPSPCQNCDKVAVGDPICACNFNDVNHLLDEYLQTCECSSGDYMYVKDAEYRTLSIYGPISDCGCCCSGSVPWLNTVSAQVSCNIDSCSAIPCSSTKAIYNKEGECVTPALVCSPDFASFSQGKKCYSPRYKKILTYDTGGGNNHGRTFEEEYFQNTGYFEDGNPYKYCDYKFKCSGSKVTTTEQSGEETIVDDGAFPCSGGSQMTRTDVETITYNSDCTTTTNTECTGSSSGSSSCPNPGGADTSSCTSSVVDCGWVGSTTSNDDPPFDISGPCVEATESTTTIEPPPNCTVTTTYTEEATSCWPENGMPSFPAFTQCVPEGQTPPEIELQPGQGYDGSAFKFSNKHNSSQIYSEQKFKYRIEHYVPPTCYLKVWVAKVTQKWKELDTCAWDETYEDSKGCTRTKEVLGDKCSYDEGRCGCCSTWRLDGEPTETISTLTFSGGNPPCLKNEEKERYDCENIEYGSDVTVTAGDGEVVTVYIKKYSYSASHEPNDPAGKEACYCNPFLQGCKQNGCPVPEWERDPSKCPKCSDYECEKNPCDE